MEHLEVIKALAPLLENSNASSNDDRWTPIFYASRNGDLEIIKFLVPLSKITSTDIKEAKFIAGIFDHDQRWTRLQIFQAPRSLLLLKHAKFLQSALSLFGG